MSIDWIFLSDFSLRFFLSDFSLIDFLLVCGLGLGGRDVCVCQVKILHTVMDLRLQEFSPGKEILPGEKISPGKEILPGRKNFYR